MVLKGVRAKVIHGYDAKSMAAMEDSACYGKSMFLNVTGCYGKPMSSIEVTGC
jgi:hypothetical protein